MSGPGLPPTPQRRLPASPLAGSPVLVMSRRLAGVQSVSTPPHPPVLPRDRALSPDLLSLSLSSALPQRPWFLLRLPLPVLALRPLRYLRPPTREAQPWRKLQLPPSLRPLPRRLQLRPLCVGLLLPARPTLLKLRPRRTLGSPRATSLRSWGASVCYLLAFLACFRRTDCSGYCITTTMV